MVRSQSSARWLQEHFGDPYVKRAWAQGWRSRAAFKLEELLERDQLLGSVLCRPRSGRVERSGRVVVDLGAAPGGWSQLVRSKLGESDRVLALDILPMQKIHGVEILEGDFRDDAVFEALTATLQGAEVDLVLSDMAPNITGMDVVDQAQTMHLAELAKDFAYGCLKRGGSLLVKLFQGRDFDAYVRNLRTGFTRVTLRKPAASRSRSREVYALAVGCKERT